MSLFSRKPKIQTPELNIAVETIPAEFFGGVNPVVQFKTTTKVIETVVPVNPVLTVIEKRAFDQKTAAGSKNFIGLLTSRKFIFVGLGAVSVVVALLASGYYFLPYFNPPAVVVAPPAPIIEQPISTPVEPPPVEVPPPIVEPEPEIVITPPKGIMDFPSILLGDSIDSDNDDITDLAEELFMTEADLHDSDHDKYPDGHEVYYLYNPTGKEPMKLIASGLVKEYVNPVFDYKLYYPKDWAVGNVDANHRDVLFSTLTGENIEVRVFDLNDGQTLSDWVAQNAPGERFDDLTDFTTSFKTEGRRRIDNLVYYFSDSKRLYVIVYNTTDSNTINYRIVAKMLARSFRMGDVKEEAITTLPIENEETIGASDEVEPNL